MCVSAAVVGGSVREQSGLPVISLHQIHWKFLPAT